MTLQVLLDGQDVTNLSLSGSWTRKLNRPSVAQITLPLEERRSFRAGSKLKILHNGQLVHHGRVLLAETEADQNGGTTVYNSSDPMELWNWRVVRDVDGDYTMPTIVESYPNAPTIIEKALLFSEDNQGPADDHEGPLFLEYGDFPLGGVDVTGAPVDWPMTIAELASVLCSTGELDIVLTPIDSGGNMARIDTYHGDYGSDRSGSVYFEYGTGGIGNIRSFRHNEDMTNMVNKLIYLAGGKKDDQHWYFGIDGSTGDIITGDCGMSLSAWQILRDSSQAQYGVRQEVKIFDTREDGYGIGKCLYARLWMIEAWLRAVPRTLVHIQPIREEATGPGGLNPPAVGSFDIGDLVGVNLYGTAFPGGLFGVQRVYEYTVEWDQDSVLALGELQTSSDAESIST